MQTPPMQTPEDADPPHADPHPLVNRMTHRCKHITLPKTSFAGGNNTSESTVSCKIYTQIIGGSRGGREGRTPPLGVQILSISCSFRENLACSRPPWRVHAPPRENPGSATANRYDPVFVSKYLELGASNSKLSLTQEIMLYLVQ